MEVKNKKVSSLYKIGFYIVLGVLLGNFVKGYIFFRSTVIGDSMNPTYVDGDTVSICRLETPERGDIVILKSTEEKDKYLIKRCIGLPGDTIQIIDGTVYINDKEYKEDYLYEGNTDYTSGIAEEPITLGDDEYFVLGDNRVVSKDSRYLGAIKQENILGVVL